MRRGLSVIGNVILAVAIVWTMPILFVALPLLAVLVPAWRLVKRPVTLLYTAIGSTFRASTAPPSPRNRWPVAGDILPSEA